MPRACSECQALQAIAKGGVADNSQRALQREHVFKQAQMIAASAQPTVEDRNSRSIGILLGGGSANRDLRVTQRRRFAQLEPGKSG
jgi:hypothetical protein